VSDTIALLILLLLSVNRSLLDVGPTAEGDIIAPMADNLLAAGKWLKYAGDCVYATVRRELLFGILLFRITRIRPRTTGIKHPKTRQDRSGSSPHQRRFASSLSTSQAVGKSQWTQVA
jgi:hypothetical protein